MSLELVFLGTGTSAGIPMIGCDCAVCRSDDPRNRRDRASVLVRYAGQQWLIDASPEVRQQSVRHGLKHLDGVLLTHAHADHVLGIDDLRRFNAVMNAPLDLYAEPTVIARIERMFDYIFASHRNINPSFVATLIPREIHAGQSFALGEATWTPLRLMHGNLPVVGYRVDYLGQSLAYCTDVSLVPEEAYELLADLDLLVIDALRYKPHATHLTVEQALKVIERCGAKRALLTHIAHEIDHATLADELPEHVQPSWDGLVVKV